MQRVEHPKWVISIVCVKDDQPNQNAIFKQVF